MILHWSPCILGFRQCPQYCCPMFVGIMWVWCIVNTSSVWYWLDTCPPITSKILVYGNVKTLENRSNDCIPPSFLSISGKDSSTSVCWTTNSARATC
jgi:hypothetical protein